MADDLPPLPFERIDSEFIQPMIKQIASAVFDVISVTPDPEDRLRAAMSATIFLCGMCAGSYELVHRDVRKPKASELMRLLADRIEMEEEAREERGAPRSGDRPN